MKLLKILLVIIFSPVLLIIGLILQFVLVPVSAYAFIEFYYSLLDYRLNRTIEKREELQDELIIMFYPFVVISDKIKQFIS